MAATEKKELAPFTKSALPILEFDFDDIKKELSAEMSKYNGVVVTLETLKADKKLAADLRAKGAEFNRKRIEQVRLISAPIVVFTDQMNELKDICTKSAELISKQVKVFEDETLNSLASLLTQTINNLRKESDVDDEFFNLGSELSLVKLGSLTKKEALTKGAIESLRAIVNEELALQGKVNYRLLQLESESHKAGLDTPLTRISVDNFLLDVDSEYAFRLGEVISSELARQNDRKEKEALQAAQKLKDAAMAATKEVPKGSNPILVNNYDSDQGTVNHNEGQNVEQAPHPDYIGATADQYDDYANQCMQEQSQHQQEPAIELKTGHVMCIATAIFKVSVPSQVSESMVQEKLIKMLEDAGVTTLDSVQVRKLC